MRGNHRPGFYDGSGVLERIVFHLHLVPSAQIDDVTVALNGQTIIDNKEIPSITGGAMDGHEKLPGPIYLQGNHGGIAYRNIVLTPAVD